ncbi:MAG: hypothetical protein JRF59_15235 [Deltaproteobacteria bacterium]|nr:hypothetical protein [Deltaproteobacteria bacterium]MBW2349166.1 hypothetical protein [Deltaproteobacteria bacterium]
MRCAIVANPAAGRLSPEGKLRVLEEPAGILGAEVFGLDTVSPDDFARCARFLSETHDLLVAAGGDGTILEVINAVDTRRTTLAYLPLGSGNGLRYALHYPKRLTEAARRIRESRTRAYDLVLCNGGHKTLFGSLGVESEVLRRTATHRARGIPGLWAYGLGTLAAMLGGYRRVSAVMRLPGETIHESRLLSLVVAKLPYYGFGLRVIPHARPADGRIHLLAVAYPLACAFPAAILSSAILLPLGKYRNPTEVQVALDRPLRFQSMGEPGPVSDRFTFSVLPGALRMRC